MIYALLTFILWGFADLYYKKGNKIESKYSHLKTAIIVGIVMFIHATLYVIINKIDINIMTMIKYLSKNI